MALWWWERWGFSSPYLCNTWPCSDSKSKVCREKRGQIGNSKGGSEPSENSWLRSVSEFLISKSIDKTFNKNLNNGIGNRHLVN